MFQDVTGEPVDLRLIDFQMCRLLPPVVDVTHLLCFTAPENAIENLPKYLKVYYDSFSVFLRELGSDPDALYPFEVYMNHWKKYGKFGIALILFALRIIISEEHEAPSLRSAEEFNRTLIIDTIVRQEEHDRRIICLSKKFVELGWI